MDRQLSEIRADSIRNNTQATNEQTSRNYQKMQASKTQHYPIKKSQKLD
ncbi:MAG: hypothetical protein ACJASO_001868 [Cyclobacteriaceae bacterium]|jgi:hypothetical protein